MYKENCNKVPAPKNILMKQRKHSEVSQPVIFVASMDAVEKLETNKGQEALDAATYAVGLILGEYLDLCFAGTISFADGMKITKDHGDSYIPHQMQ